MIEKCSERWHLSGDGYEYLTDFYASRDEAIRAGMRMYSDMMEGKESSNDLYQDILDLQDHPEFYVGIEAEFAPGIDGYAIIEHLQCEAYDFAGEHSYGWLDNVNNQQRETLDAAVKDVVDRWISDNGFEPSFFAVSEYIIVDPREQAIADAAKGNTV